MMNRIEAKTDGMFKEWQSQMTEREDCANAPVSHPCSPKSVLHHRE